MVPNGPHALHVSPRPSTSKVRFNLQFKGLTNSLSSVRITRRKHERLNFKSPLVYSIFWGAKHRFFKKKVPLCTAYNGVFKNVCFAQSLRISLTDLFARTFRHRKQRTTNEKPWTQASKHSVFCDPSIKVAHTDLAVLDRKINNFSENE